MTTAKFISLKREKRIRATAMRGDVGNMRPKSISLKRGMGIKGTTRRGDGVTKHD